MISNDNRKRLQVNPPIRSAEDREAMIKGLRQGDIDFLATDHAPHTKEEKEQGVSGIPHLDTYGLFVSWLMREQNFTPQEIVRACSFNPGNFVNNFSKIKYGKIAKGFAGSLTVLDSDHPTKVEAKNLKTKCAWSPFERVTFPGKIIYTIIKGKIHKLTN
jgi:dihydroorotase